jgi:hypothetical protein
MSEASVLAAASSSAGNYAPPGLVAFLIVCGLGIALYFLLKSMGKQLGKAKEHFDAEEAALAAKGGDAATMGSVPAPKPDDEAAGR